MIQAVAAEYYLPLPHPAAAAHVMMVMMTMVHRAVMVMMVSHAPSAETAEGIVEIPRAAIPEERAGKQSADEGQYNKN